MKDYLIKQLHLTEELSDYLMVNAAQKQYSADSLIIEEGKKSNSLYFIKEGIIAAFSLSDKGEEYVLLFFKENNFFGGSMQAGLNNTISFKTLTRSVLYEFNYNHFFQIMNQKTKIQQLFQANLNNVHKIIQQRILNNISMNAKGRYIEFTKDYPELINRIPHYYIASYLGITSTQLSRIRKKLLSE